jgi:DNA-binding transcriptional regulator YiaG
MKNVRQVIVIPPTAWDGARIKTFRASLGISQAAFATLLGVSLPLVRAWEQNVRPPHASHARLLDCMLLMGAATVGLVMEKV